MRKIDIHCHSTKRKLNAVLPKSAFLDEIEREMTVHDIDTTVLLATYFPHRQSGITNFRLQNWISGKSKFKMFGSLDFEHYFNQGMNELEELADNHALSGIKIYTCYQNIDLNSEKMASVLAFAKNRDLPLMFHSGYSYTAMRTTGKVAITTPVKPSDLEFLMRTEPDVQFIISHLAKPFLDDLVGVIARNPNVVSDMSGLIDSKYDRIQIPSVIDYIKRYLGECGPKKLLFGTDFPVQTHADSVYFIEEAMKEYCLADKRDVYFFNSGKILEATK